MHQCFLFNQNSVSFLIETRHKGRKEMVFVTLTYRIEISLKMYFFRDAIKTKNDFVYPNKEYILYHVVFYFNIIHVSKIYLREYENIFA